uniref:F-box domain-containing protein n=1 Tax=Peronospora matthiolae TaxID=2874970 RepID=A0AAV1UTL0_9STRA
MELCDLPRELLARTLQFIDHASLLQLEVVSHHMWNAIVHCDTWRILAHRLALYAHDSCTRSSLGWKRLALLTRRPVSQEQSVLLQVRDCTSVDHINESAQNTLTRSHCSTVVALLKNGFNKDTASTALAGVGDDRAAYEAIGKRLQLECGCARGRPCYWSSAPTWECTSTDHLDYTLSENALVESVQIVPYRVFWYPGSPTYSPKRASFAFYELRDDGEVDSLVYESTVFHIVMDMTMETFELPRRVFLSRGMLRLTLFDRQEDIGLDVARWMQEYNLPPYYTCLSYVGATGLLERGCW